jgi:hypothetical protein
MMPNVRHNRRDAALSRRVRLMEGLGRCGSPATRVGYAQAPARKAHCESEKRSHRRRKLHRLHKSRRWRYGDHGGLTKERGEFGRHRQADRAIADDRRKQPARDRQSKPKPGPVMRLRTPRPQPELQAVNADKERKPPPTAARLGTKARHLPYARATPTA